MFRDLRADEIEIRVAQATQKGVSLLLYKDARCDQNILDETVTPMNWQRYHSRDNANCTVAIWDEKKSQWISKEDTGTESYTEKEKGLASDSFKRACFNWGIGRELYTSPFIWVRAEDCKKLKADGQRWKCKDIFVVDHIEISNKRIVTLAIRNMTSGKIVFKWQYGVSQTEKNIEAQPVNETYIKTIEKLIAETGTDKEKFLAFFKVDSISALTMKQGVEALKILGKKKK